MVVGVVSDNDYKDPALHTAAAAEVVVVHKVVELQ